MQRLEQKSEHLIANWKNFDFVSHLIDDCDVAVREEPVAHEPLRARDDEEQVEGVAHAVERVVVL